MLQSEQSLQSLMLLQFLLPSASTSLPIVAVELTLLGFGGLQVGDWVSEYDCKYGEATSLSLMKADSVSDIPLHNAGAC